VLKSNQPIQQTYNSNASVTPLVAGAMTMGAIGLSAILGKRNQALGRTIRQSVPRTVSQAGSAMKRRAPRTSSGSGTVIRRS
jgi:hypothetical protein